MVILDIIAIIISALALISSFCVGHRQTKISETQMKLQNKVELYILSQAMTLQKILK